MIIGSLCSGPILDHYGRKLAHVFLGIPFVIGWIIIACANSTSLILLGRFITGISAGGNRPVTMVYIGEIADPKIRAIALYAPGLMIPLGILSSHVIGYYLGWRISSIVFAVLAGVSLIAFFNLTESPLWLIAKGRTIEGVEIFRWFRGNDEMSEIELETVLERNNEKANTSFKELIDVVCSKSFITPMLILLVVMINSQVAGLNALSFYSQDVFEKVFSKNIDPFNITITMDFVRNLVSLLICVVGSLVPRKLTFLISNFGIAIFSFGLLICFETDLNKFVWIPATCLVVYIIFASVSVNTGWTFIPELLPTSARGLGSGLNSTFSYISLFITVKTLPDIVQQFSVTGLFAYFAIGTLITGVILSFTLPETNGKTLQSIEDSYNKKKVESNVS